VAYILEIKGFEAWIDLEFDRLYTLGLQGKWALVREQCQKLLAESDTSTWAHLLLGYAELRSRNFEVAYQHFSQGISLPEPLGSESSAGAGRALLGLGRNDGALHLLQQLVTRFPDCHFAWHALGETCAARGDHELAWSCVHRATEICPTHSESVSLLVSLAEVLSRHAELIVSLEDVQRAQPWNLDVRGARALSLLRDGRHAEAVDEMTRVVSFAPYVGVSPAILAMIRQSLSTTQLREA